MNTRKYPRTLNEAFGPYARGPITEKEEPMHTSDKIVLLSSCIAFTCIIGFMVFNWIN